MTFEQFQAVAMQNNEIESVCMHGENPGCGDRVAVTFKSGKLYFYSGSYADILRKIGIKAFTKREVIDAKKHLERLEEMGGRTLFGVSDIALKEINHWREYVKEIESGIII